VHLMKTSIASLSVAFLLPNLIEDGASYGFWPVNENSIGNVCCGPGKSRSPDSLDGISAKCMEYKVREEIQERYYNCVRSKVEGDYEKQGRMYSIFVRNCQTWMVSVFARCNRQVLWQP
jgi:hypothetical protein